MKPRAKSSYEVLTRRELYEVDRPGIAWPVWIAVVLTTLAVIFVLRRPLLAALAGTFSAPHL